MRFLLPFLVAMATGTNLTAGGVTSPAATTSTASITPTANALILAWVFQNHDAATTNPPTLSGNGLTWVQVATVQFATSNRGRLTVFRAMGASPSTGVVTITHNTTPTEGVVWSIDQWTGTDTSGTNGSGAIAQSNTATGTTSAGSVGVSSAPSAGNPVTGALAQESADGSINDSALSGTKLGESGHTISPDWDGHLMSQYQTGQTLTATLGSFFTGWGGIAIEILNAGGTVSPPPRIAQIMAPQQRMCV